jgi:hypothetical protein
MIERLRSCCCFRGSLDIRKVKSLRVFRCNVYHQSFATPSSKMEKSYSGYPLTMSAALRTIEKSVNKIVRICIPWLVSEDNFLLC